ncbi:hypothetical protein [Hymenobacter sp. BRD67]|uniref:hypothetical protein n=1 Tax=Hymenobacter sp. BRD67 TaxID=2675877 RepID=UPI0020B846C9|nr:hypothetical protein [Hymenobacter sp. BRD67]
MDKQAAELRRDLDGATVERVGEGIKITFASGILFGSNSATLTPGLPAISTSWLPRFRSMPILISLLKATPMLRAPMPSTSP